MKKKNLFLLLLTCILSLTLFACLLVSAFIIQSQRDHKKSSAANQDNTITITQIPISPEATIPTNSPSISDTPAEAEDDTALSVTPVPTGEPEEVVVEPDPEPIVLGFAGDINFDEASKPMKKYDSEKKGILGGISEDLINEMNSMDIMMLNNEFAYSTRGTKTPDKSFTFRADPSRVEILKEMGVDIVSLANNHALDYGKDALIDTFETLDNAGIHYVGAGDTMDRAKAPIYFTVGDKKIAYVAASRVVFAMDWYATDTSPGMIGTYDPALFLESIREAKENSDFVVAFVHWGVERNNYPEDYQQTMAKQYIDAGADAVIGCHPHVLQGIEFYNNKPIVYSLGNYWFGGATGETGLLKLYLDPDDTVRVQMIPAMAKNTYTYMLTEDAEREDYFQFISNLSFGITIDEFGFIHEAE
ncbi:CapA family protein [Lachnospiraceae bacterium MD1]|uniref:CapA family protein n=1 Tax=Variimorphobacter saccharofermentans TaxID=2755051 RepID=A0A839JUM8_9FIRM|nr:CapA family protein [Variimorphobacter saccharofermentans]MBB2181353.1 CapA family protein [Variimorphobacter saccharofermentans]